MLGAWCGGTLDVSTDTLWIPIGGGHLDYAGNEAYRVRLDIAAPVWTMPRNPSGAIGNTLNLAQQVDLSADTEVYSDGRPRAIHSYNEIVHVPNRGNVIIAHGGGYPGGNSNPKGCWQMNDTTGEWTRIAQHTGLSTDISGGAGCYDSLRDRLWWHKSGNDRMRYLALSSGATSFTSVGAENGTEGWYLGMQYIAQHDLIALNGGSNTGEVFDTGNFKLFDPTNNIYYQPGLIGSIPSGLDAGGYAQAHWVESLGCLCFWNNSSNTTQISTLRPTAALRSAAWEWGTLPLASSNAVTPSVRQTNGTYGRFQFSPRLNGFYLLNQHNGAVYFYALS